MKKIAVTGAGGFIGKNVMVRLREEGYDPTPIKRELDVDLLAEKLASVDFVIHLAGVNRPEHEQEFKTGNLGMSERVASALRKLDRPIPILYSSSIQAEMDNPYGRSKRAAENALLSYGDETGVPVHIWRLPNVFGKWCRPNYNSVVATFCNNIAQGMPISVRDPAARLHLVYVDDVVDAVLRLISADGVSPVTLEPIYETTVGELATSIQAFRDSRHSLVTGPVGSGLQRALHATYLSYLRPADFAYSLETHQDPRGTFTEMLRTPDAGQFSFFTAHPGIRRGGHYHHSKTEKFLVVQGKAKFGFRHILTNETYTIETCGDKPTIVETVPGWSHDITNVGEDLLIVLLWANEIFDRERPDTYAVEVMPQ